MFDCWMSLDLNYATRLAQGAHRFGLKWLEECLSTPPPTSRSRPNRATASESRLAEGHPQGPGL